KSSTTATSPATAWASSSTAGRTSSRAEKDPKERTSFPRKREPSAPNEGSERTTSFPRKAGTQCARKTPRTPRAGSNRRSSLLPFHQPHTVQRDAVPSHDALYLL